MVSGRPVDLPESVRQAAAARGAAGLQWMRDLGALIAELEREWNMTVAFALEGGTTSYVAQARIADGTEAILKVQMPEHDAFAISGYNAFADEIKTLLVAEGRGYARVFRHDSERRAMLQERLGRPLSVLSLPIKTQIEIICTTLRHAWVPVPPDVRFQTGAEKARGLATYIVDTWTSLNEPCSERTIERALSFAEMRVQAFDTTTAVLLHGDAHHANTLENCGARLPGESGFKLVDPSGLFAERAYDLAIPMRSWNEELLACDAALLGHERCAYLSALTGVDPHAIWQWGFMERVSTGLFTLQLGFDQLGRDTLNVADAWAMP